MAAPGDSNDSYDRLARALSAQYVIKSELGGSSMSRVFLAEERALGRRVVIKVLPRELAAELSMERFAREINIAAVLQQANIIPVFQSGTADGLPYYTMPFMEGLSLRQRLSQGTPIPLGEALGILLDVAKALAYAHARGVVHRDIKPGNVLLSGGTAVVIDFGIAKAMLHAAVPDPNRAALTQLGFEVGTPAYMAPEQAGADPATDHRADLYAWGVVAYEVLCGAHPFAAALEQGRVIAAHMSVRPRSARAARADLPPAIATLVDQCLEKNPNDRPQSADAILRGFDAYHDRARAPSQPRAHDSIAVLPFSNLGASAEDEYFADGMSDDLISSLAKLDGLRVVARTSAFAFKRTSEDVRTIGAGLGVSCVLEGSLRRAGRRLRVTARLVDAYDGFELWTERYDRELTDIFAVQDDISRSIAGALRIKLLGAPAPLVEAPTGSMGAYELYLKGRFHANKRTEASLQRSLSYYKSALVADPALSLADAGQGAAYVLLAIYGALAPRDAMREAGASARRVLAAAPRSADALAVRGSVRALYEFDWQGAEEDFLNAINGDSQSPTPHHWYAMHCLVPRRRFSEAAPLLARARALDPLSAAISTSVGILRYYQRSYDEAARVFGIVLDEHPDFALALYFLGQARTQLGDHRGAIEALARAARLTDGSPEIVSALGVAQAVSGDAAAARESIAQLQAASMQRYVSAVNLAQIHVALGERAAAMTDLTRAAEQRAVELALLGIRPSFDSLRDVPEFESLVVSTRSLS